MYGRQDSMMNKHTIENKRNWKSWEEEQRKDERRGDYCSKDTFQEQQQEETPQHIYIFSLEDLDNDDIISMVETTPALSSIARLCWRSIQSKQWRREAFNSDTENGGITITFNN